MKELKSLILSLDCLQPQLRNFQSIKHRVGFFGQPFQRFRTFLSLSCQHNGLFLSYARKLSKRTKGRGVEMLLRFLRLSAPQPLFSDQSRKVVIDGSSFIICLSFSCPHDVRKLETRKGTNVKAQKRQIESSVLKQ